MESGYPLPGPQIRSLLKKARTGLEVARLAEGTCFQVTTGMSVYTMVVSDPKAGELAVQEKKMFPKPTLCYLQGASAMGLAVAVGKIAIALRMKFNPITGGLVVTSPVSKIKALRGKKKAAAILKAARDNAPKGEPVTPEKALEVINAFVDKHFAENTRGKVKEMLARFPNPMARGAIVGVLDKARKAGILEKAFEVLERVYQREWVFMHPLMRGSCEVHERNAYLYEKVYKELGIIFPARQ
jgi:hypothetical protein